jgi:hypothetical protein
VIGCARRCGQERRISSVGIYIYDVGVEYQLRETWNSDRRTDVTVAGGVICSGPCATRQAAPYLPS